MMVDALIGKLLDGGTPYVITGAVLLFLFKPPKWATEVIHTWIANSKTRAASFERLLTASSQQHQIELAQLQALERAMAEHLLRDSQNHSTVMLHIEKVGQKDRHDERQKYQASLATVTADVHEARDYLCERIDEAVAKVTGGLTK